MVFCSFKKNLAQFLSSMLVSSRDDEVIIGTLQWRVSFLYYYNITKI